MTNLTCLLALVWVVAILGHANLANAETPGERFRKAIKEIEAACAKRKLAPNEVCGEVAKLKPPDPLATEEGRFAHSIKIPNPVPADSGYKPGMTPEQYFEHLCKTEAGEFIYKTVENVEGIYMMRPRKEATDDEKSHLYALEDLYGDDRVESTEPENYYVGPKRYRFFETSLLERPIQDWEKKHKHSSMLTKPEPVSKYARYYGYDGRQIGSMKKEYDVVRKSKYGYTWRGLSRPNDRELGIVGGELIILDLQTNEVLAVRRGYLRGDVEPPRLGMVWARPCPLKDAGQFILKVLKPTQQSQANQGVSNATK